MQTRFIRPGILFLIFACVGFAEDPKSSAPQSGAINTVEISTREKITRLTVPQIIAHRGASAKFPENTLASAMGAVDAKAQCFELDVRSTRDHVLVPFHDATLNRTTNGTGPVNKMSWDEIKTLDAGSWKDPTFKECRVPRVTDVLGFFHRQKFRCEMKGEFAVLFANPYYDKIDILLDLKEQKRDFVEQLAKSVKEHGNPARTIIGVHTVEHARLFRKLLPSTRQLGLIADPAEIENFAQAGVEMIRLWPHWLTDESLIPRVRKAGVALHLNGTTGLADEIRPLMKYLPDSLSTEDPSELRETLSKLSKG